MEAARAATTLVGDDDDDAPHDDCCYEGDDEVNASTSCSSIFGWRYVGEGGKHAIFTRQSKVPGGVLVAAVSSKAVASPSVVLRVRKCDLVPPSVANDTDDHGGDASKAPVLALPRSPSPKADGMEPDWIVVIVDENLHDHPDLVHLNRFLDAIVVDDDDTGGPSSSDDMGDVNNVHGEFNGDADADDKEEDRRTGDDGWGSRCCGSESFGGLSQAYLDRPAGVRLSDKLVRALRTCALESGNIPASRRKDWMVNKLNKEETGKLLATAPPCGLLLPDYRFLNQQRTHITSNQNCRNSQPVCLEIKPKAGYAAFSPLVKPDRRAKYTASRFALLQTLWVRGAVDKGWAATRNTTKEANGGQHRPSRYDPLDLFSSDRPSMERALRALLFETPQNNGKLWIDGHPADLGPAVPSREQHEGNHQSLSAACTTPDWTSAVNLALNLPESSSQESFVRMCSEILLEEPLLSQILRLQQLDVLDADGAIVVYHRLVHGHCGGSYEKADRLIDKYDDVCPVRRQPPPSRGAPHQLLSASPWVAPEDTSRIASLCEVVERTQECLVARNGGQHGPIDDSILDELHVQAVRIVNDLSEGDCVYLLRNWLLSLTMNDASFFLTLAADEGAREEVSPGEERAPAANGASLPRIVVVRRQTKDAPGIVRLQDPAHDGSSSSSHHARRALKYQIKLIDCDPKPAKKLRDREAKEVPFLLLGEK
jgi:Inositol-pentakisphosphate 2-kinase